MNTHQTRVKEWLEEVFPDSLSSKEERCLRLLEEAMELSQACGVSESQAVKMAAYVFGRDVGVPKQEVAGCLMTILAAATALELDIDSVFEEEMARAELPEVKQRVIDKQAMKKRAGVTAL